MTKPIIQVTQGNTRYKMKDIDIEIVWKLQPFKVKHFFKMIKIARTSSETQVVKCPSFTDE